MPNLAVSDISVFGNGGGKAPETQKALKQNVTRINVTHL